MPSCPDCGATFELHADEKAFLTKKMEFRFGDTVIHPLEPRYCPECRMLNRTCHRNERTFYRTTSAKSGKEVIALYAPRPLWGHPYQVYTQEEWRCDDVDPMQYGRPFDFSRSFFDQFAELVKVVPRMNLITVSNENCPYTTGTGYCKHCYLINSSEHCQDCYHGKLLQSCRDSMDCSYLYDSELCYECFSVYDSYNCQYLLFSKNCRDCFFSSNLNSCSHCCLCTNLHRKEYHFLNEPLPKEEYERRVAAFRGSYAALQEMHAKLLGLRQQSPQRAANIVNCEHCTGDYIENSKNCVDCYDVTDSEDCRCVQVGVNVKDNYDCSNMYLKVERCYEVLGTIEVFNAAYCYFVFHSQNMLYCDFCFNCSDCFGCSGLTRKKHCIFNTQYTQGEYNTLVQKLVEHMRKTGEWGSFFPRKYAPFGYNESLAHEYVPLTKEQALQRGFLWRDDVDQPIEVRKKIPAERLPDMIDDIPDDVLNWAITCDATQRPYRVIRRELDYYRRMRLPIPHLHPDERHRRRMKLRNPRRIWDRKCQKCNTPIQTTYPPERTEVVCCEQCYLQAVY